MRKPKFGDLRIATHPLWEGQYQVQEWRYLPGTSFLFGAAGYWHLLCKASDVERAERWLTAYLKPVEVVASTPR